MRPAESSRPADAKGDEDDANLLSWLTVVGARQNNLDGIDVHFPLGRFIAVTGVSGSGKSSLVNEILRDTLLRDLNGAQTIPGHHDRILGWEALDKVIDIDQSPIGRTPRSNPATYIKVFDEIRSLFAKLPESRARGWEPGRFSFNVDGGRCEACEGNGSNRLNMDFLADVWVTCRVCEGRRFGRETLQVRFKDRNIHDILEMEVEEAIDHFVNVPKIHGMLETLRAVGLEYLKLGQPSPTLSGGEAQRIKLAKELCRRSTGRTLYILDEPTTGLHFEDVRKLLAVLHGFVDAGNTVVVIEHHLDVIKTADWVIDLGPEGGTQGGAIVAEGTPEEVARCPESHTGQALAKTLMPRARGGSAPPAPRPLAREVETTTHLVVEGARQHNLQNVSTRIPLEQMTVFCGPSGSGKSSLAIDTLYAEGQRRYVESLSSYARQFLGQMQKPLVERVSGLSPAISIEQKTTSKSPRSTVGTITEIYDYFRVLFARLGQPHCPSCRVPIQTQTSEEIVEKILHLPNDTKVYLLAPLSGAGYDSLESLFADFAGRGFARARVDGQTIELASPPKIDRRRRHEIELVVDRLAIRGGSRGRLAESVEVALEIGRGVLHVARVDSLVEEKHWRVDRYSQHRSCDQCGRSFEELTPNHFSFNSSLGWCPSCEGLGIQSGSGGGEDLEVGSRSLRQGALRPWPNVLFDRDDPFTQAIEALARHVGFSLDDPFDTLAPEHRRAVLYGTGEDFIPLGDLHGTRFQYKGVFPSFAEAARTSWVYRQRLASVLGTVHCPTCHGTRLREDAAAVRLGSRTIGEWGALPLAETLDAIRKLLLTKSQREIAGELLREIENRLRFLVDVGLDYLSLDRPSPTLSGGEAQRIRLASQLGSGLTGVLYLLDEPTIGLHPRDNARLLQALARLRDLGNTLVLVEHDREVIAAADRLVDFGPGSGRLGGRIVAEGSPDEVTRDKDSLTGRYLAGREAIPIPTNRRTTAGPKLRLLRATHHNLKEVHVDIPLGALVAATGVSGSGKSSLIQDCLWGNLARRLHRAQVQAGYCEAIEGIELVDKVILVDQQPLGNTPSSNPATYTGLFDELRELFAKLPEARVRGYTPGRFSFNRPGGRCEACEGVGERKIEMHFLPDVWVTCEVCQGKRYTAETLAVQFKGHSIADVLEMTIDQALGIFAGFAKIRRILRTLSDVGLGYMALGQSAPTLSGGESQRVKLAAELARPNTGRTMYILDEPTTGLHFDDLRKLIEVLHRLVDLGNTVVVIEHNLDVIKTADWVIDLGPEAGDQGGNIVFAGPPEELVALVGKGKRNRTGSRSGKGAPLASHTAVALRPVLEAGPFAERPRYNPLADEPERPMTEELKELGEAAPPWETDGRRWHLEGRTSRTGKSRQWEPAALSWLAGQVEASQEFEPTDWNDRGRVEIRGAGRGEDWFLRAFTGEQWLLKLKFQTARRRFQQQNLAATLGLAPLSEIHEIPMERAGPRVRIESGKRFQEIQITVFRQAEIETDAFRTFLDEAISGWRKVVGPGKLKPRNGPAPDPKSRAPSSSIAAWEPAVLPTLLEVLGETVGGDVDTQKRSAERMVVQLFEGGPAFANLELKHAEGLRLELLGPGPRRREPVERSETLRTVADIDARLTTILRDHARRLRESTTERRTKR